MPETNPRKITLVLGGVRSGKSRFAQKLAEGASCVGFVATARPVDAEMQEKIRRHQEERPKHWRTLEEPLEIAEILAEKRPEFDMIVVDCLTTFVANVLEDDWVNEEGSVNEDGSLNDDRRGSKDGRGNEDRRISVEKRVEGFLTALRAAGTSVVLVSNEVGSGVVPAYASGRRFRDLLGEVNQQVAAIAHNVVLMIAGLPVALKGKIEAVKADAGEDAAGHVGGEQNQSGRKGAEGIQPKKNRIGEIQAKRNPVRR